MGAMTGQQDTIGKRVAHLREARKIKSTGVLSTLLAEKWNFDISRQALAALERGAVDTPRMDTVEALAKALDTTTEYLLYGPRSGEEGFVVELTGLAPDLSDRQRDQLLWLAHDMAEETRATRLDELSDEESEMVALLRGATPEARSLMLAGWRSQSDTPAQQASSPREGQGRRRGRSA